MRHLRRLVALAVRRAAPTAVAILAALAPAVAWAQSAPPSPSLKRAPAPWIGYMVIFVLLAVVVVVSLLPSKRGHQD